MQVHDRLAEVLAGVLDIEHVPVDANFFTTLADSLVMAKFCARVRKEPDLPPVSIKDIYQNPTISALAAALAPAEEAKAQVQVHDRLAEVLAGVLDIEHVPVDANFFHDLGADSLVMAKFCARVCKEPDLPRCPSRTSTRTQRSRRWPRPWHWRKRRRAQVQVQDRLAEMLAGVLGVEQVAVGDDFFHDLGADSLAMARFCARVRKEPDLPAVSIKDVFHNPTVGALAVALAPAEPLPSDPPVVASTLTSRSAGPEGPSAAAPKATSANEAGRGRHRALLAGGCRPRRPST